MCLLPCLGKVVILERMREVNERGWDEWQYGCQKGRCVDDRVNGGWKGLAPSKSWVNFSI